MTDMDATEDSSAPSSERRPSIKDVAVLAGVSWRTVSNVIHGHRYLRPETKEKVEAAIKELGYRPRVAARQLRGGKSHLMTLAVPYIANPYFASLAHAVVEAAGREDYVVLIDETLGLPEREKQVARGYGSILTDGIIFSPLSVPVGDLVAIRDTTPLVLLGQHTVNPDIDHVIIDNVASTRAATEHVLSLGRRRIGFMGYLAEGTLGTGDLRFTGYQQALTAAGIPVDPSLIIGPPAAPAGANAVTAEGDYSREEGFARAKHLIPRIHEFDAIVCANDLLAIGLMHALRLHGIRIPEDIAVIGWDNSPEGAFTAPTLSTVAPDLQSIAALAVETLLGRMEKPDREAVGLTAPHRLIVRGSTAGE